LQNAMPIGLSLIRERNALAVMSCRVRDLIQRSETLRISYPQRVHAVSTSHVHALCIIRLIPADHVYGSVYAL
jgi:hypothetical protein